MFRKLLAVFVALAAVGCMPPSSGASAGKAGQLTNGEDMLAESSAYIKTMKSALTAVLRKQEEARSTKDVVKLNCVNERLTQVKGLITVAEQSDVSLHEAVANKDAELSKGEFAKVSLAKEKVLRLREDSEQCIGQLAFTTDESTSIEVETPDNLPAGDTSQSVAPAQATVRPPPASPTL